jgi:hypothetical protein
LALDAFNLLGRQCNRRRDELLRLREDQRLRLLEAHVLGGEALRCCYRDDGGGGQPADIKAHEGDSTLGRPHD